MGCTVIALFDTSHDLSVCEKEIGMPAGQLITPLSGFRNRAVEEGRPWAMDNGAFSGFKTTPFLRKMVREEGNIGSCLFVASPDVVGSHDLTMDLWGIWVPLIEPFPPAFVLQDGWDGTIPHNARAVFVGGSTEFKCGDDALEAGAQAKELGLWVHVGRVNTPDRVDRWRGLADSIDGTGIGMYTHMRHAIRAQRLPGL